MYERPFIDSLEFAGNGGQITAQVPFAALARLQDVLDNPQGILHYTLQGGMDKQGRPLLNVSITGDCQLRCQRCLSGMDYTIQIAARLLLCDQDALDQLDSEGHVAGHPEEEGDFDGILAEAHLDVLALLEEEILLGLPIAPKHQAGACQVAEGKNRQQDDQHPFALLEKLKHH